MAEAAAGAVSAFPAAPGRASTPVHLLTGFLGSGKTTLLARLLALPDLADTAVLINEFGEVGLDHQLLERIDDTVVLLPSGCVCCTVRGELADALRSLHGKRERGVLPWFTRVVIESTGLADPFPILTTVHADPVLRHHFHLAQVVTTVDALHGDGQLDAHEQSVRQAALADLLVVTKAARAGPDRVQMLVGRLRAINPLAAVEDAEAPGLDLDRLLRVEASVSLRRWSAVQESPSESDAEAPAAGRYLGRWRPAGSSANRHDADIRAHAVTLTRPLDWSTFAVWLTMLVHCHGAKLLRIKGLLDVEGSATPVAVHGVQQLVHPPQHLAAWPDDRRQSSLVFIAKGLDGQAIERSLRAFLAAARPAQAPGENDAASPV